MNKTSLLIPICISVLAGCFVSEGPEPEAAKMNVAASVASVEKTPSVPAATTEPLTTERPRHIPNQGEIRRLQIRLKELGFDPGPADGIAGTRTKAALVRFQTACSAWQSIHARSAVAESPHTERGLPVSNQDVRLMQTQLRRAGFDAGPIDGIFGLRTKAAWLAVTNVCPSVGEFSGILTYSANAETRETVVSNSPATVLKAPVVRGSTGSDRTKQAVRHQSSPSREEVRILQLRLRDAGFDPGPFDGVMGPKTRSALQQYDASQRGKKAKISLTESSSNDHY